jgi:hypothetical protein
MPADLPAAVQHQLALAAHDVFANGHLISMRPTVMVAVAALAIATLPCLFVEGQLASRKEPVGESSVLEAA